MLKATEFLSSLCLSCVPATALWLVKVAIVTPPVTKSLKSDQDLIEPRAPSPNENMGNNGNSRKANQALHIKRMELLGFLVG